MQTKFLVAFILSCTAAFVASAPVPEPTPAPVVDELAFAKRQDSSSSSQSLTISLPIGGGGGMHPDTCRYGCTYELDESTENDQNSSTNSESDDDSAVYPQPSSPNLLEATRFLEPQVAD
ncbi:hypothetical protein BDN72DRAFT_900015 [Pluteus cervinus]|uniref:Uncharacterized protein n=1 Tax=Pluteus cervinus TaxID=181527 RepID=A0ACD3AL39_9AGAR|nr:hypothetical protein BDN72DRAFT_900015 [Pluteus cervinus]